MQRKSLMPILALGAALFATPGHAQDPAKAEVVRSLAAEDLGELLKDLKIDFKKDLAPKSKTTYFDYTRNQFKIRLHLTANGKELMVDALFPAAPLDLLNQWNLKSKYARAVLDRDKQGDFTAIESNLNLAGGVTPGAVKLFLESFDEELAGFQKFIALRPDDSAVYTNLTTERIEALLKNANVVFQKTAKDKSAIFEFKVHDHPVRLTNFAGQDIMLDAYFPKIPLEAANQWNLKKKFIRTVIFNKKGTEFTALESNLEILGGVSDGIVRQFLANYTVDLREFQDFVKSLNKKHDPQEKQDK